MNAKNNIQRGAVDVYVAPIGTDINNLALWVSLGWSVNQRTHLQKNAGSVKKLNGFQIKLEKLWIFEAEGLEIDATRQAQLEALQNQPVDILLIHLHSGNRETLKSFFLRQERIDPYGYKQPKKNVLRAIRHVKQLSSITGGATPPPSSTLISFPNLAVV